MRVNRRKFISATAAATAATGSGAEAEETSSRTGFITDVGGLKVGHAVEKQRPTGCTVLLFDGAGAVAGVDVRGAAPGTRDTDLLNPVNSVQQVQAILLSGGSAYGLDAAGGVMRFLEERGLGFKVGSIVVPIVPQAILFDLGVGGDPKVRPTAETAYQACLAAKAGAVEEGNVGAGAGATVGKMFGMGSAMKAGIGTASARIGSTGVVVGAIVAVNAVGDVVDPKTGSIIAGARNASGKGFRNTMAKLRSGELAIPPAAGANTTIGVVATNAAFDKAQMTKIAQMAHDGLARTINPIHTPSDGDTLFAVSTGKLKANHGAVGAIAAEVLAEAVLRAVRAAKGLPGLPAASQ